MARDVIVISDSLLKHCSTPGHADIVSISGVTTETLIGKIRRNCLDKYGTTVNWRQYYLCILHVGTNDVGKGKGDYVFPNLREVVREIRNHRPSIDIVISGILPRPKEHKETSDILIQINKDLKAWCDSKDNLHFHPSFNSFLKNKRPIEDQNLFARDRLHLGEFGIRRMCQIIKAVVTRWRNLSLTFSYQNYLSDGQVYYQELIENYQ